MASNLSSEDFANASFADFISPTAVKFQSESADMDFKSLIEHMEAPCDAPSEQCDPKEPESDIDAADEGLLIMKEEEEEESEEYDPYAVFPTPSEKPVPSCSVRPSSSSKRSWTDEVSAASCSADGGGLLKKYCQIGLEAQSSLYLESRSTAASRDDFKKMYKLAEQTIREESASSNDKDAARKAYSVVETLLAKSTGTRWQDRGPEVRDMQRPGLWRQQRYRPEAKRWGNRGGKNREHFAAKYGKRHQEEK